MTGGRTFRLRPWAFPVIALGVAMLSLVLALVLVDRVGESIIDEQANASAVAERNYLTALATEKGLSALVTTLERHERVHGSAGFRYALTDANGHPLAGDKNLSDAGRDVKGWKVVQVREPGKTVHWHVLVDVLPTGENLVIAQDAQQRRAFRLAILEVSGFAILLAALACTGVGLVLSVLLLRRANTIAATAQRIAAGDLQARVETVEPGDVFDKLGGSLNAMLTRIEELMTGLRTVTDSLAHDMRMPLTRLKGALSRAGDPNVPETERFDAISQAQAEADHALAMFSALIDIARAESGLSEEMMQETDISGLATEVAELFSPVLEDAGQQLTVLVPQVAVTGRVHPVLLRQAIGNLLHNAAKYAGAGARVSLSVEWLKDGYVRIVVADTGPGIPAKSRGIVPQRFVKLDPARHSPGSGLGLAIVAACAKLHRGQLLLEDNRPGLRAILALKFPAPFKSA